MPGKLVDILLVEDDEVDVMAIRRAFAKVKIDNPLYVARDGIEALEMLRGQGGRDPIPRPYIVLLDLNMPRMGGLEFLRELRDDPDLRASVVFVLTTSKEEEDIVAAYRQNVAGYLVKAKVGSDFMSLATLLGYYWQLVELPGGQTRL